MSNQIVISSGAKVRNLSGVLTGTSGIVSSVPLGAANGVATLDSLGKVPLSQLPASVVTYLGTWNASTNTPTLANGTGDTGDLYICNVAGTVNFGAGPITFAVGDWVIYSGTTWERSAGASGTVTSVAVTESGDALTITGSPITTSGTINIGFAGTSGQYINGAGGLTTFPDLTGYVTLSTAQTITGAKTFTTSNIFSGSNLFTTFSQRFNQGIAISESANFGSTLDYTTIVGAVDGLALRLSSDGKKIFAFEDGATDNTYTFPDASGTIALTSDLSSYVPYTGAIGNVNLGEYGLSGGYIGLDTTPTSTPTSVGTLSWDTTYLTPKVVTGVGDTTLQIGQEEVILVHNNTGSTLTDGQVVYVTGSTGELPSVSLADASSETTSAATLGVVTESIAQGTNGFITISGLVHGLNTLAYNEGDLLWLSETAGQFTNVKPISPAHLVLIGYVIKKAGGNGSILVKIQNTQELEECSDVLFTSLANNDILAYESSTDLWKNKTIANVLGYTPANDSLVVHLAGTETITGAKTFSASLTAASTALFNNGILLKDGASSVSAGHFSISSLNSTSLGFQSSGGRGFDMILPTSGGQITIPNGSGTLALTSDLSSYLPLSGGTLTGALSGTSVTLSSSLNFTSIYGGNINGFDGTSPVPMSYTASQHQYYAGDSLKMMLLGNGNLLLGTTTDNGALLQIAGAASLTGALSGTSATFSGDLTLNNGAADGGQLILASSGYSNWNIDNYSGTFRAYYGSSVALSIASNLAATFSSSVTAATQLKVSNTIGTALDMLVLETGFSNPSGNKSIIWKDATNTLGRISVSYDAGTGSTMRFGSLYNSGYQSSDLLTIASSGAATFSSTISATGASFSSTISANGGGGNIKLGGATTDGGLVVSASKLYLGDWTTLTKGLVIDMSSGNVGIGTTAPAKPLEIYKAGSSTSQFKIGDSSTSKGYLGVFADSLYINAGGSYDGGWSTDGTNGIAGIVLETTNGGSAIAFGTASGNTSPSERMRITSAGNLLVNNTSSVGSKLIVKSDTTTSGSYACILWDSASTDLMYVRSDGYGYLKASAWAYGSDKRIKENINYIETGLDKILALKPAKFDYIDGLKNNIGWIAQDVQKVIPEAVGTISEDNDQLTLKSDFIVPYLVKAIQELNEKIKQLENK